MGIIFSPCAPTELHNDSVCHIAQMKLLLAGLGVGQGCYVTFEEGGGREGSFSPNLCLLLWGPNFSFMQQNYLLQEAFFPRDNRTSAVSGWGGGFLGGHGTVGVC